MIDIPILDPDFPRANSRLRWGLATDVGRVREGNEDSLFIDPDVNLFLVSDGMGGHRGGELASRIIIEDLPVRIETGLHRLSKGSVGAVKNILRNSILEQNRHLEMEGRSESGYSGMGATIVTALLVRNRFFVANVGDSRAYLLRGGKLEQITIDQTVVTELVEMGKIDPEQAQEHPERNVLLDYMGMEDEPRVHLRTFAVQKEDRLLLCSDGLTDMVEDADIKDIILESETPQGACDALVAEANLRGGIDNITAILIAA